MAVIRKTRQHPLYFVIHPLDDEPEVKCDVEHLGRMPMTPAVRISLLDLAGTFVKLH